MNYINLIKLNSIILLTITYSHIINSSNQDNTPSIRAAAAVATEALINYHSQAPHATTSADKNHQNQEANLVAIAAIHSHSQAAAATAIAAGNMNAANFHQATAVRTAHPGFPAYAVAVLNTVCADPAICTAINNLNPAALAAAVAAHPTLAADPIFAEIMANPSDFIRIITANNPAAAAAPVNRQATAQDRARANHNAKKSAIDAAIAARAARMPETTNYHEEFAAFRRDNFTDHDIFTLGTAMCTDPAILAAIATGNPTALGAAMAANPSIAAHRTMAAIIADRDKLIYVATQLINDPDIITNIPTAPGAAFNGQPIAAVAPAAAAVHKQPTAAERAQADKKAQEVAEKVAPAFTDEDRLIDQKVRIAPTQAEEKRKRDEKSRPIAEQIEAEIKAREEQAERIRESQRPSDERKAAEEAAIEAARQEKAQLERQERVEAATMLL